MPTVSTGASRVPIYAASAHPVHNRHQAGAQIGQHAHELFERTERLVEVKVELHLCDIGEIWTG